MTGPNWALSALAHALFWLRVAAGLAVGICLAALAIALTPPVYAASTSVLVEPVGVGEVNMRTEVELVRSTQIANDAVARLGGDPGGELPEVEAVPGTLLLQIVFEARTPELARAGATAFAEAYLANRGETARQMISAESTAVQRQYDELRSQLDAINEEIARTPGNSPDLESLRTTQASLSAQAAVLTTRLTELQSATVTPGRVVTQANLPQAPARPHRLLYLGVGALLGLLGGVVGQLVHTRWSRRVRDGGSLRRHRLAVLATLEPAALATGGGPTDPNGRAFSRLRNEIIAALAPHEHVLLVTSAAPGGAATLVAASLAAAFARTDNEVTLVGASATEPGRAATLATIFDLADVPGLTDVLAGRTVLPRAVQRAPRAPRLKVITPGGTATASGLLQSEAARSVLAQLATRTRYVIVDAPSTASGADAQSLATAADAALLVVEVGRTQHAQVADAMLQLERVGIRLLGAVVVPGTAGPYGLAALTSDEHRAPRLAGGVRGDLPAWSTEGRGSLDGPTATLDVVGSKVSGRASAWGGDTAVATRPARDDDASESPEPAAPAS